MLMLFQKGRNNRGSFLYRKTFLVAKKVSILQRLRNPAYRFSTRGVRTQNSTLLETATIVSYFVVEKSKIVSSKVQFEELADKQ